MAELVGVAEIAMLLGISRQRVNQLVHDDPTFPGPEAVLAAGRIWRLDVVLEWATAHGRLPKQAR